MPRRAAGRIGIPPAPPFSRQAPAQIGVDHQRSQRLGETGRRGVGNIERRFAGNLFQPAAAGCDERCAAGERLEAGAAERLAPFRGGPGAIAALSLSAFTSANAMSVSTQARPASGASVRAPLKIIRAALGAGDDERRRPSGIARAIPRPVLQRLPADLSPALRARRPAPGFHAPPSGANRRSRRHWARPNAASRPPDQSRSKSSHAAWLTKVRPSSAASCRA